MARSLRGVRLGYRVAAAPIDRVGSEGSSVGRDVGLGVRASDGMAVEDGIDPRPARGPSGAELKRRIAFGTAAPKAGRGCRGWSVGWRLGASDGATAAGEGDEVRGIDVAAAARQDCRLSGISDASQ